MTDSSDVTWRVFRHVWYTYISNFSTNEYNAFGDFLDIQLCSNMEKRPITVNALAF